MAVGIARWGDGDAAWPMECDEGTRRGATLTGDTGPSRAGRGLIAAHWLGYGIACLWLHRDERYGTVPQCRLGVVAGIRRYLPVADGVSKRGVQML